MVRLRPHASSALATMVLFCGVAAAQTPPARPVVSEPVADDRPAGPDDDSTGPDDRAPGPDDTAPGTDDTGATPVSAEDAAPPVPVVPAADSALTPDPQPGASEDVRPAAAVDAEGKPVVAPVEPGQPKIVGKKQALPAGVTFSGIPAVTYIADNGVGFGAVAAMYFHDGVTSPYRTAVTLQLFLTTKLVQDHNIIVDSLRLFDLPLRLNARVGYLSSVTQNYCGVGGSVTCDAAIARAAADDAGLSDNPNDDDDEHDAFARHYYQRRFMSPYGLVNFRYALIERTANQPFRVEATFGYRAFYFIPGNVFADDDGDGSPDLTPYAGSLFAKDHPDGEPGLSSVVQAGLMLDSRDNEPSPTEGWFMEGSVRSTTPGLSSWNYGGFNVTVRGYTHLPIFDLGRRLVLANRFTVDGLVGDVPIQEMARLGGSQDVYTFGGADTGRGIRVQRYLGKARVIDMVELRYRVADFTLFNQNFAVTPAVFVDAALIGDELIQPKDLGVIAATGGALRLAWNENFIVRLDVGVSPAEKWAPQIYITINNPF